MMAQVVRREEVDLSADLTETSIVHVGIMPWMTGMYAISIRAPGVDVKLRVRRDALQMIHDKARVWLYTTKKIERMVAAAQQKK